MGCLTVLKGKKKKSNPSIHVKRINPQDPTPTTLPEPLPLTQARALQSAPPSFRTRVRPVQPSQTTNTSRMRAWSAPSTLDTAEQDPLSSSEFEERCGCGGGGGLPPIPQPLPLPAPHGANLKTMGSFKVGSGSGPLLPPQNTSGPLPLPPSGPLLPPTIPPSSGILKNFSFEEIAAACRNFSPDRCVSEGLSSVMYRASFGEDTSNVKNHQGTVTSLHSSSQDSPLSDSIQRLPLNKNRQEGLKEFISEVNTLASLQHPYLCKLIGFHAREGSDRRMLVYERLFHGSLDRLLYGRTDGPPIDWNARMKVALCAAQGLTFLHEEGPFQAMFHEFSTANIQIDKDFSAKLSGYGCISHIPETDISNSSVAMANLSVETLERGLLTPKSNVWSFGIMLLELLTGRKNLDCRHPKEERNLIKWSRPFLADDSRLSLIMDPQLKGRFPARAARTMADIAQKCLQTDPSERPTMRTIVEHLKIVQEMKFSCRFPLQEPGTINRKHMAKSLSLNGIIYPAPRLSYSPSPPPRLAVVMPSSLPPRNCASNLTLEGVVDRQESRRSSSSARRSSVEGF